MEKEVTEKIARYRQSAEQGDAEAQFDLGLAYCNGTGVVKDARESVQWYRKAAEQGHILACVFLGIEHTAGRGVARNTKTAYIWFSIADALGFEDTRQIREEMEENLTLAEISEAKDEVQRKLKEILKRKSARQ